MKNVTGFFPLHPVPFYGQDFYGLFWYDLLNLKAVEKKDKKQQNTAYFRNDHNS